MVPKKSRINSVKIKTSNEPFDTFNNITESCYNKQAINYQKQIKNLKQEIVEYKKQVIALQTENNILRNESRNLLKVAVTKDTRKLGLMEKNVLDPKNRKLLNSRLECKVTRCSCKGNCSNKICGCVKKNVPCEKFCKCNNVQCKNQKPEKENINIEQIALSERGQTTLEKLGMLTLNEEILHASKTKAKDSKLRSFENHNRIIKEHRIYPESSVTFKTKRQLFTQNSDEIIDIDIDQDGVSAVSAIKPNYNFNKFRIQVCSTSVLKETKKAINLKKDFNIGIRNNIIKHFLPISKVKQVKNKQCIQQSEQNIHYMDTENKKESQVCNVLKNTNNGNSNQENIYLSEDISLNPMVPKHELQRSPINAKGTVILPTENKWFSPLKKELTMAEINWEQHQSELIMCNVCKRKFFPHRIEKHLKFCKGI